jgi:hypothetical protein
MLKIRIQICIVYSISYLLTIKVKSDYRKNTVSDRFHPYLRVDLVIRVQTNSYITIN